MTEQIYVALLDEGIDVWRPVPAVRLAPDKYVILRPDDYDPTVESWQFLPGTMVICEPKQLSEGIVPVAIRQTRDSRQMA